MKFLLLVFAVLANQGLLPDNVKPIHAGWRGASIQYGVEDCGGHFRVISKFVQKLNVTIREGNEKSFRIETEYWDKKNGTKNQDYVFKCTPDTSADGKSLYGSKYRFVAWSRRDLGFMEGETAYRKGDFETALKKFSVWAEQGDEEAQFNLGQMYQSGQGVVQNYKKAVSWFRKAAEQEYENAQFSLALKYGEGKGVTKNYKEAARWYRKAAVRGHAGAQYNLGQLFLRGDGVVKDYKEAAKWYRKAANQRIVQAQNNLGVLYMQGLGVSRDFVQAHFWFNIADRNGHPKAKEGGGQKLKKVWLLLKSKRHRN